MVLKDIKIMLRLDTDMYFIVKPNGEKLKNAKGVIYFADIKDAEKARKNYFRQSTPFERGSEVTA